MEFYVIKQSYVESCGNYRGLLINYLKNNDGVQGQKMLEELNLLEKKIRDCVQKDELDNLVVVLTKVSNDIEVLINE